MCIPVVCCFIAWPHCDCLYNKVTSLLVSMMNLNKRHNKLAWGIESACRVWLTVFLLTTPSTGVCSSIELRETSSIFGALKLT